MRAGAGTRPPFAPARSSKPFPMPIDDEKSGRPKRTTPAKGGYSQLTIRLTFPIFCGRGHSCYRAVAVCWFDARGPHACRGGWILVTPARSNYLGPMPILAFQPCILTKAAKVPDRRSGSSRSSTTAIG